MGRGPKPARGKAKPAVSRKSPKNEDSKVRDLGKRLVETLDQLQTRDRELSESQEQQIATAEILRIISSSPTDVQPVLEAVAENAARLCESFDSSIFRRDGDRLLLVAHHGPIPFGRVGEFAIPLTKGSLVGRSIIERRAVQVTDLQTETEEFPLGAATARQFGYRTSLAIPLLRESAEIGAISIRRTEVRPFTERQGALLQTFADQAVIAIENVRLFNETKEALDRQTATSEILRVISQSPTDAQPVFDTIAQSAVRLSDAVFGAVFRLEGERIHLVAQAGIPPKGATLIREMFPISVSLAADSTAARAIMERGVVHVLDTEAPPAPQMARQVGRAVGFRSQLTVPMLRGSEPIGAVSVSQREPGPFSEAQIELLKTFADQAVIAIENVRLFTELQEKNQALTTAHAQVSESLEQQTATSDILRAIASSPTDVQPVFDTMAESAASLCKASDTSIFRLDGDRLRRVAHRGSIPAGVIGEFTVPLVRGSFAGRCVLDGRIVHIADGQTEANEFPEGSEFARRLGFRAILLVPLVREGVALGVITLRRTEPLLFTDRQVALLQTFADQAVIAIENVRLFKELEEKNQALTRAHAQVTESLEQQTATSEILRVISRSQTDVQPVFDTIVQSAVRLLRGYSGALVRVAGNQIVLAALTTGDAANDAALRARFPQSLGAETPTIQAIRNRVSINVADAQGDARWPDGRISARIRGYRSLVAVPLIGHDEVVGAFAVTRREPGGFTDDEIALLQTFADQAVIAIENARLLNELQERTQELTRSVEQLTALGDVGRAVSSSLDLDTVLSTIVGRAVQLSGTDGGTIFEYDEIAEEFSARATRNADAEQAAAVRAVRLRRGEGAVGQMAVTREPFQIPDIAAKGAYDSRIRGAMLASGTRSVLAVPLLHEDRLVGGLVVTRRAPGVFTTDVVELLKTFATQSALAIQNARLFRELEIKSRELEVASQHKSEFLANMSHELRTPLNAIIGFSEVLSEKMFGELNEKQEEYLKDIHASGQHLLSLINDILDLSKIEAGRMELELTDFHLPTALDSALTLVRERAGRRSIALHLSVDERLGQIQADERKIRQVVLNLLSNAIKFTPEGGRIEVLAAPKGGFVEVSVTDTGVGIAPEDQEAVFEEFRQVGTADKKVEGTGLGLTLCRKFVELHGGRIWVKSELGKGSTFTFTIPVRRSE